MVRVVVGGRYDGSFPFLKEIILGDGLFKCNTGRDFLPVLELMQLF